jgi:putative transposase
LRNAIHLTRKEYPFDILAWVLLPDHLHAVWKLPETSADYSIRWRLIKARTTRALCEMGDPRAPRQSRSRERHKEQPIWQRRFWEHTIRDEDDLRRHIMYVHYNPVKHGLVTAAPDWPYSTLRRSGFDIPLESPGFDPDIVSQMECE